MEFYHLRSFVVVAQTGNLTLAAKQLYTTPPAVSAHIKALEEELQVPLFVRSSKGMTLTEKGELLLKKAQKTLDSAFDLVNTAASSQDEIIGTFRLGMNQKPAQLQIPRLIENLLISTPGITLQIQPVSSGKTIEAIRNEELDGGFIYGEIPSDLAAMKIKSQRITTIAPFGFVSNAPLETERWITMGYYCPFDIFLKSKLGREINAITSSDDDATRLELVKSGLGISFYELEDAQTHAQNNEITLLSELDFDAELYFVVAQNKASSPITKAVLQELSTLWNIN
ncbi:LysR family transcriptional regulator [Vibrio ziniensis]|uniref:LysR family transcriptional regulator n=1 Tax=Vibrio ziniensis TaxID=2711221 RepID=A0A6G7CQW1_9VIBR|nr:LysR family transcriptional regulator [Vibrio ziniensis]QIH44470.1 LysR family transcriptional regulator [Vibrio ziniensis]